MKYLFTPEYKKSHYYLEKGWIIYEFFDVAYDDNKFIEVIACICNNIGYSINDVGFTFPDLKSIDESLHFDGVLFYRFDEDIFITDDDFKKYVQNICEVFLEKHPEHALEIKKNMSQFRVLSNGVGDILQRYNG